MFVDVTRLYEHIPKRHFYERLSGLLDLTFLYELTKPLYADKMGRPSLDPVVFFKCQLFGFFENVVSDTRLEFEIADSLLARKFIGYTLEERTPDESTLRKTRQRMPLMVFERVFSYVLEVCQREGLLKGRVLGTDGTLVDANASMDSLQHKELGCSYEEYIRALRRQDEPEATREDAVRADREREGKASNKEWESGTDADSKVMQHADGHTHLSYKLDTTVDLETGVIVQAGASHGNVGDASDFLQRVDEAVEELSGLGLAPEAVVADKGHHTGENLAGMEERGLVALVSSRTDNRKPTGFRREDFEYDPARDVVVCPVGERLRRVADASAPTHLEFRSKPSACRACPHFGVCTKSGRGRSITISVYEGLVAANRLRVHSEEWLPWVRIRRQYGEAPFAYFKMFGGLRRLSGRGLEFAMKKALLAALGFNLLKVVRTSMLSGPVAPFWAALAALRALYRLTKEVSRLGRRLSGEAWRAARGADGGTAERRPTREWALRAWRACRRSPLYPGAASH